MSERKKVEPRAGVAWTRRDTSQRAMRTCLGPRCRGEIEFLSDGPGNRICPDCRPAVMDESSSAGGDDELLIDV